MLAAWSAVSLSQQSSVKASLSGREVRKCKTPYERIAIIQRTIELLSRVSVAASKADCGLYLAAVPDSP